MRSFRVTATSILYMFFLWYIVLSTFLGTFIPYMENKLFILFSIYLYLYYNINIARYNGMSLVLNNVILVIFSVYACVNSGVTYIIHLDYYAYVGLFYLLAIITNSKTLLGLKLYLEKHINAIKAVLVLYVVLIVYTIVFKNGLQYDSEALGVVLYGPYSVPHEVGYQFAFLYSLAAFGYFKTKDKLFLVYKGLALVGVMFTGARSAFVALLVLIFIDYYSMRKVKLKVLLAVVAALAMIFLCCFTDVLSNSAVIQKTITNIAEGSISNNRDRFWRIVFSAYKEQTSFIGKMFGIGIDGVRASLKAAPNVNVAIHAHNDFVNILCGYGVVGLGLFLLLWHKLFNNIENYKIKILMALYFFMLIFTNGFAMYNMVTPALGICIVFAICCVDNIKSKGGRK